MAIKGYKKLMKPLGPCRRYIMVSESTIQKIYEYARRDYVDISTAKEAAQVYTNLCELGELPEVYVHKAEIVLEISKGCRKLGVYINGETHFECECEDSEESLTITGRVVDASSTKQLNHTLKGLVQWVNGIE